MSYGCSSCTKCCTVTPLFWVYTLGLAGTFASLFLFFWQYPGTLTQFMGPKEEGYLFVDDGGTLSIYRDGIVIASGIEMSSDDLPDLRRARCRGTSLLWTMLIGGLLSVLFFLWWFVGCPNRFICCSLQQPYETMHSQLYPVRPMMPAQMPGMKTPVPAMPSPITPPPSGTKSA